MFVVVAKGNHHKRRNRVEVVPAHVLFAAQVEPVVRRHVFAAVARDHGRLELHGDRVAVVIVRMEIRHRKRVADRVDVPLQRPAFKAQPVVEALSVRRVYRAIDGVVGDRRRDLALVEYRSAPKGPPGS